MLRGIKKQKNTPNIPKPIKLWELWLDALKQRSPKKRREPRKQPSYFPLYWLFNRDLSKGLWHNHHITGQYFILYTTQPTSFVFSWLTCSTTAINRKNGSPVPPKSQDIRCRLLWWRDLVGVSFVGSIFCSWTAYGINPIWESRETGVIKLAILGGSNNT